MCARNGQAAPPHYHVQKREDIICRGGGRVHVLLSAPAGRPPVTSAKVDGIVVPLRPGEVVILEPGSSVEIPPYTIHKVREHPGLDFGLAGRHPLMSLFVID